MSAIAKAEKTAVSADDLQPLLSERWVLGPRHWAVCLFFSAVFLFVNAMPLADWAIWPDVYLGRWMLDHGALPQADPAQPWSEPGRVTHGRWLSQIAFGAADRLGGPQAVSNLFTGLAMASLLVLARVVFLRADDNRPAFAGTAPPKSGNVPGETGKAALSRSRYRIGLMLAGVASAMAVGAGFDFIASLDVFGTLCFGILLGLLAVVEATVYGPAEGDSPIFAANRALSTRNASAAAKIGTVPCERLLVEARRGAQAASPGKCPPLPWPVWLGTAGLFALWANLHGSYLLGIGVLACCGLAAAGEAVWRTRSFPAAWRNASVRTYMLLTATALVASWLNPYGPGLAVRNLAFLRSEYTAAMPHWRPPTLAGPSGIVLLASAVLLVVVLRVSPRPVRLVDVLLPGALGAAVFFTRQAQSWYALVWVFAAMPHVSEIVGRRLPQDDAQPASVPPAADTAAGPREPDIPSTASSPADRRLPARDFAFTLMCGLTLYCAFSLAPGSQAVLGGSPRPKADLVGSPELLQAAEWLQEHAPNALVYAAPAWSDFLLGHAGEGVRAMLTSNIHRVPPAVRDDYVRIARAEPGWQTTLDRYGVEALVLSRAEHGALIDAVRRTPAWTIAHQADAVVVARRAEAGRQRVEVGRRKSIVRQVTAENASGARHPTPDT